MKSLRRVVWERNNPELVAQARAKEIAFAELAANAWVPFSAEDKDNLGSIVWYTGTSKIRYLKKHTTSYGVKSYYALCIIELVDGGSIEITKENSYYDGVVRRDKSVRDRCRSYAKRQVSINALLKALVEALV